jgi:hypothetical protein
MEAMSGWRGVVWFCLALYAYLVSLAGIVFAIQETL